MFDQFVTQAFETFGFADGVMDLAFDVADTITVLNYGEVVFDGLPGAARDSQLLKDIYLGAWEDA